MTADVGLVSSITHALARTGDPQRAVEQQRYMKSELPFHGVRMGEVRSIVRAIVAELPPTDRESWEASVRELWDGARFREERYAATTLARHRCGRGWQDPAAIELYRHMIITGAWWDHVDEIAAHLVGGIVAAYPDETTDTMRRWMVDDDLWLRRAAVLCQLRHGEDTDLQLLRDAIEANVEDPSFWLRKAIGWALRTHARVDPEWVRAEVESFGDRLSGLSRREALKHLGSG